MKIGLDFHGVITAIPMFFAMLTKMLVDNDHEVHILTGQKDCEKIRKQLEDYSIKYTHFFSITTYHEGIGTKVTYDKKGNPWMDDEIWDRTKGDYCRENRIDFHFDDSDTYGKYFTTVYIKITTAPVV